MEHKNRIEARFIFLIFPAPNMGSPCALSIDNFLCYKQKHVFSCLQNNFQTLFKLIEHSSSLCLPFMS